MSGEKKQNRFNHNQVVPITVEFSCGSLSFSPAREKKNLIQVVALYSYT